MISKNSALGLVASILIASTSLASTPDAAKNVIPGTGQTKCYNNQKEIVCPSEGHDFYGQDAQIPGPIKYQDNGDGTVSDLITGLMWQKTQDPKMTWEEAKEYAANSRLAGKNDWRLPTVTELYSLMYYAGSQGDRGNGAVPYIDTNYFDFKYSDGMDLNAGEGSRWIDVQNWSSTKYQGLTMGKDITIFGVNFADGRIKGYPQYDPRDKSVPRRMYVRLVRGDSYGVPKFKSEFSIVRDKSTGLMWQKIDDGKTRNWKDALAYCQNLELAGYADWRLPNAKELQYLVDYTKSPTTSKTAAIYSELEVTNIESYFWTSTSIVGGKGGDSSDSAVYIAFGRALGHMDMPPRSGNKVIMDVHGAGAQRIGFKAANPEDYPQGYGPQGDDERIYNYVRCVRDDHINR